MIKNKKRFRQPPREGNPFAERLDRVILRTNRQKSRKKNDKSGQVYTLCYHAGMGFLSFGIGFMIGLGFGALAYFVRRKSAIDSVKIAEEISGKILMQHTGQILQLAETKLSGKKELIDGTLKNMKDEMKRVEAIMKDIGDGNIKIDSRLEHAATVIKDLGETAGNLCNALASNSRRGEWGERMAEDVLRFSGLIEGINYIKQTKLEAAGSKPDFTFILPQKLKLNMDVKFPFNNYQLYTEAKGERDRQEYKEKFLKDVRNRLKEIQTRDYINPEDGTVDYVLLFVPNEQIFGFINEMDRDLIDDAMRARTILCSPLSLYAILAVIRQAMDNFTMESKSKEMLSHFGAFKTQWEKFKDQMQTVQKRFESVHEGYEELVGARERQLDRPLSKIDELRTERGIQSVRLDVTIEKVTRKQLTDVNR